MKHLHRILGLGVFVALAVSMSSCIFGGLNDSLKEIAEVMEGKVFTIPTATITYSDSTTLSFAEYGKKTTYRKRHRSAYLHRQYVLFFEHPRKNRLQIPLFWRIFV